MFSGEGGKICKQGLILEITKNSTSFIGATNVPRLIGPRAANNMERSNELWTAMDEIIKVYVRWPDTFFLCTFMYK